LAHQVHPVNKDHLADVVLLEQKELLVHPVPKELLDQQE